MAANQLKIVALGDSISYGFPYTPASSWVHLAADELGISIRNKGENGDTTSGMRERFHRDVLSHKPSHVILLGGTNDAFEGIIVGEVCENTRLIVAAAQENGIIPILGLPTPCNLVREERLLAEYRQVLAECALSHQLDLIDFYSPLLAENDRGIKAGFHVDGIHPNQEGYRVMANVAAAYLRPVCLDYC